VAACLVSAALLLIPFARTEQPAAPDSEFTTAAANAALDHIQQGLDTHDADLLLSAFDPGGMQDYAGFRDQVRSFFVKYGSFRAFYSIAELRAQNGRGIVLADFYLEAVPASDNALPARTHAQIRFEMAAGGGRWRIVNLDPRSFFS
jgi:hypothetical protein